MFLKTAYGLSDGNHSFNGPFGLFGNVLRHGDHMFVLESEYSEAGELLKKMRGYQWVHTAGRGVPDICTDLSHA
ncbi:hypothetical protein AYX07_02665 [Thermoactinomyces sp. AS95]|nr:hypothetical protein JS81_02225 [Thermoactinomyces sp. Gus2-1]KYQ87610.1 hypothetical protein AYX07_02665 [Thermoactinomyces sp. AS95]